MQAIYPWPDNPWASLTVIWLVSAVFFWAAREPMLELVRGLGGGIADGLAEASKRIAQAASELHERSRDVLLAAGTRDAQGRLDQEIERMDAGFSDQVNQYSKLQRRLDDKLLALDKDYQECGIAPPDVPGWTAAVQTLAGIPQSGDPNIRKVLEGIQSSSREAERKALAAHRSDSAQRHKLLGAMLPVCKEIRSLLTRMTDSVGQALESSARIDVFVEDYRMVREEREQAARALTYSATKFFFVSALVLAIALGGAFINFQLIALPMSELVPAGARVGGVPVSTISALVLVLMEAALGIFLMDMLGITELFPKLSTIPRSRRRLILGLALAGLFFLSSVEASLAILREQIVEADAALKLSLAGEETRIVQSASQSMIPVVGQAVLGFILPWVLALVAVPLEMLLDSGRHIAASLSVTVLRVASGLLGSASAVVRHLTRLMTNFYDVYISIPLRIERMIKRGGGEEGADSPAASGRTRASRGSLA